MRGLIILFAVFAAVGMASAQESAMQQAAPQESTPEQAAPQGTPPDTSAPVVTASFDRDSVMIGDRFHLDVRVEKDLMQMVDFPRFAGKEIAPEVEVLSETPVDTLAADGRRQTIGKRYVVTVWREGNYSLGVFPALYLDKNVVDTLYSRDSLHVSVGTFDIDPAVDKPFDIKPPREIPLRFGEISGWSALGLAALAVVALAVWLFVKYRRRRMHAVGSDPSLPPHMEAIRRLEALRHQKLPQNGKFKNYYSGLTDILRGYLDGRFGIGAMEMTSDEILEAMEVPRRSGEVDGKRYGDLAELLRKADLVKFAKFTPDDASAETDWYDAYYFVEETKQREV